MIGPKIGTIITNYFSNIRFATAIYFRGAAMFCFLKPSFLTGGDLATVVSNVGEERKPGRTTEAAAIL
jgi:hypothetical protein